LHCKYKNYKQTQPKYRRSLAPCYFQKEDLSWPSLFRKQVSRVVEQIFLIQQHNTIKAWQKSLNYKYPAISHATVRSLLVIGNGRKSNFVQWEKKMINHQNIERITISQYIYALASISLLFFNIYIYIYILIHHQYNTILA
jgi:hypothetical protein